MFPKTIVLMVQHTHNSPRPLYKYRGKTARRPIIDLLWVICDRKKLHFALNLMVSALNPPLYPMKCMTLSTTLTDQYKEQ